MLILKSEFSKELSYTAKGILYTIINSNGQKFFTSEYLMELSIDNYETVKAAINELLFLGYILSSKDGYSFNNELFEKFNEV